MLIVVAIIAILAGILLPALNKARAKAHSIACSSNLKQMGTYLELYAMDNNDHMLPAKQVHEAPWVKTSGNWTYWYEYLTMNYILKTSKAPDNPNAATVLRCPADNLAGKQFQNFDAYISYGLNGGFGISISGTSSPNPFPKRSGKIAFRELVVAIGDIWKAYQMDRKDKRENGEVISKVFN